jgi:predicted RNase H-like nuclease (RuvC/YqgF family)
MIELAAATLAHLPEVAWSAGGAIFMWIGQRIWTSPKEKKVENRKDFEAITNALFMEIHALREDVEKSKAEAGNCESKYNELSDRFVAFKAKYNELELRYQIQVNINKKLGDEIKGLEAQVQAHLSKENNEQNNNSRSSKGTSTE